MDVTLVLMTNSTVMLCITASCYHQVAVGPLQDPITWYGINYVGTLVTQWDLQTNGKSDWTGTSSFVLEVA